MRFRVWNKTHKEFQCLEDPDILFNSELNMFDGFTWLSDKIEIQFSTGINDEDGQEIFDGDLVVIDGYYGPYRIFWENAGWCSCAYSDCEYIGNYKTIKNSGSY